MTHPCTSRSRVLRTVGAVLFLLCAACASDSPVRDPDAGVDSEPCVWEVDELLSRADLAIPNRVDCGSFNVANRKAIVDSLDCLLSRDDNRAAELNITRCTDCATFSTYVVTSNGKKYHIFREADEYGDEQREVKVERCDDIAISSEEVVECENPLILHDCQDALMVPVRR